MTYADTEIPPGASLVPSDVQLFLKRLRTFYAPIRLRYFAVGEYGDQTGRPHYHLAIFGVGPLSIAGLSVPTKVVQPFKLTTSGLPVYIGDPLYSIWGKGHVFVGDLTKDSAQYIAGYVTKKMTNGKDQKTLQWLNGRHPEFARMSLRPGIGATAMEDVASVLFTEVGQLSMTSTGDVPSVLAHGKKKFPLGRYLRRKLRENLGFGSLDTPKSAISLHAREVQILQRETIFGSKTPSEAYQLIEDERLQSVKNVEAKYKIHRQRGQI